MIKKQSGADVPKRQVEQLAIRASRDFDEFYRDRLCRTEDTNHLLVLSFDAKVSLPNIFHGDRGLKPRTI